jgi:choline transport protein
MVTFSCCCLLSLINIGSTTAFNAILSVSTISVYFSYAIPIALFALRRFNKTTPIEFGPWRLGAFGLPLNLFAIGFCVFLIIFLPFPTMLPVTAANMNYASPLFIAVIGFSAAFYLTWGKTHYRDPVNALKGDSSTLSGSPIEQDRKLFGEL